MVVLMFDFGGLGKSERRSLDPKSTQGPSLFNLTSCSMLDVLGALSSVLDVCDGALGVGIRRFRKVTATFVGPKAARALPS